MIKHDVEQGTDEWLALRSGIPTASELGSIITPKWLAKKGQGVDTYLAEKLAERWLGAPLDGGFNGGALEQGKIREEEARPYYEFTYETDIQTVGFVTTDDGEFGCSPDGMFTSEQTGLLRLDGIEIKCPKPHTHVGYLLAGVLPEDYLQQVHGSMYVTGASQWVFMSYCRKFPQLVLTVRRDEKIIEAIHGAVSAFVARLDTEWNRLCKINGGPPERKKATVRERVVATFPGSQAEEEALKEWLET